jgi:spore maturation protein CgeB
MKTVLFCHSLLSDWNHGNAHFLRGVVTELVSRGHAVEGWEPRDAWSLTNLVAEHGEAPLARVREVYPALSVHRYDPATLDLDEALDSAELVMVHEWNDPALVGEIGRRRAAGGRFHLLFHDTHHRSVTDADGIGRCDLSAYDGVLAFGEAVREVYLRAGWGRRVWTWHEAADTRVFHPMHADREGDLVWIGNWGDDERTEELRTYLLGPIAALRLRALVHGVRYPPEARAALAEAGIRYGGWLPNHEAPATFARFCVTVHVPRRPYAEALPGIPTIRVFEALACGIPLVSAPWRDAEGLFRPGEDFLYARDGADMTDKIAAVLSDPTLARSLARHGLETVLARHTCAHRVDELLDIVSELEGRRG